MSNPKEIASAQTRLYPRTRRRLNVRVAREGHGTIAELVEKLSKVKLPEKSAE